MGTYILIIFMATSRYADSGSSSVTQEFNSYTTCKVAGDNISKQLITSGNEVFSIGCYQK